MAEQEGLRIQSYLPTFDAPSSYFGTALLLYGKVGRAFVTRETVEGTYMDRKMTIGIRKSWKLRLGFVLLLGSVLASCAHDTGKKPMPEEVVVTQVVVTRKNLYSFSSGSGCKSVPYTGLVDGRAFVVAEAFVRMELWTPEGLRIPLPGRERLIDSRIYFYQGNAYADWYPDTDPDGVCPELKASLETFPKELEGMLGLVQNSAAQLDPPCEPAIALLVNGNRVVESYEMVTDCGLR